MKLTDNLQNNPTIVLPECFALSLELCKMHKNKRENYGILTVERKGKGGVIHKRKNKKYRNISYTPSYPHYPQKKEGDFVEREE